MQTYEEYIEDMRKCIPECDWDQNEIDDTWENMCRYERDIEPVEDDFWDLED
jgi:hypothetical protein